MTALPYGASKGENWLHHDNLKLFNSSKDSLRTKRGAFFELLSELKVLSSYEGSNIDFIRPIKDTCIPKEHYMVNVRVCISGRAN